MTDERGQIEADDERPVTGVTGWLEDLRDSLIFLTRLPVPQRLGGQHRQLSSAARAFPVAGAVIGGLSGLALLAAHGAGVGYTIAASVAVLAGVLVTGALHEDGLADVADGFGAGGSKERKLEIMRDSRIGTYGVLALVLAVLLKVAALSSMITAAQSVWHVPLFLIAAGALSRTFMTIGMRALPAARTDGRSAEAGQPTAHDLRQAMIPGFGGGCVILWLAGGLWTVIAALLAGSVAYYILKRIAVRHIAGQTGDVLGAIQQITEIAILIALSAAYS